MGGLRVRLSYSFATCSTLRLCPQYPTEKGGQFRRCGSKFAERWQAPIEGMSMESGGLIGVLWSTHVT